MPTLDELQQAANDARVAYETERDSLAALERAAVAAIRRHADVRIQVLTGAGTDKDVDAAAQELDVAVEQLREVVKVLVPDRGKAPKDDLSVEATKVP